MWLVKKFRENFKDFNVKWNINYKKWQRSQVQFLNMKKYILGTFTIKGTKEVVDNT